MLKYAFFIALMSLSANLSAQSCIGNWTTIDDETKEKKSIVELYKVDGKLHGKIVHLYPKVGRPDNPICRLCSDDRKNKHVVGMEIIRGLIWEGSAWEDGKVVDPKIGKVYSCKIWLSSEDPNYLNVRGYSGPFYRTQTWVRVV
jgi:uncharacterized protein (DUF2147 family)